VSEHTSPESTPPPSVTLPPLLAALWALLLAHRGAFGQERTFLRAQALILGHLFAFARRTITQALLALGLTDTDWSAFYRLFATPRIDYEALAERFFFEALPHMPPAEEPYVSVVDGVQIPRSSNTMPGTSWLKCPRTPLFKPGPHRAQRFLHLACLMPTNEDGYSRALPLRLEPAFPEKAIPMEGFSSKKQWEAALEALRWLRENLDNAGGESQRMLVLGDGDFSVAEFRAGLPEERVVLLSRCAKNRALFGLPTAPSEDIGGGRRGRPRKYGKKAKKPSEWLEVEGGWRTSELLVRGRQVPMRWRVEGPFVIEKAPERPVFLVVVKGIWWERAGPQAHTQAGLLAGLGAQRSGGWWMEVTLPGRRVALVGLAAVGGRGLP
jgi:hypothetical protein